MKQHFGLYLILTDPIAGYEACAQAAVNCGIRYLQLRMKNTPHAELLKTAHAIRTITHGSNTLFIINDDLSIAMESNADGIHLGQGDQSLEEARTIWNAPEKHFGLSTHNAEQAEQAKALAPDYIGVGPIFPTPTKPDTAPPLGSKEAGRIMQGSSLTTVAIGGINTENLPQLLEDGIDNFCVVSAVRQSTNPEYAIQKLQDIWNLATF